MIKFIIDTPVSLSKFIQENNIDSSKIAIQVNNKIIHRKMWHDFQLNTQDIVEVIEIIAGG